jgi:hypothetical protein
MAAAQPPGAEDRTELVKPSQPALVKPRRKAANAAEREPQPVKWWLPSYKAKTRAS